MLDLKKWFVNWGYPARLVGQQIEKAKAYLPEEQRIGNIRKKDVLPLVMTYHPALNGVN